MTVLIYKKLTNRQTKKNLLNTINHPKSESFYSTFTYDTKKQNLETSIAGKFQNNKLSGCFKYKKRK